MLHDLWNEEEEYEDTYLFLIFKYLIFFYIFYFFFICFSVYLVYFIFIFIFILLIYFKNNNIYNKKKESLIYFINLF